jgi:hypothetical protein
MRRPGADGVKVTEAVHVEPALKLAEVQEPDPPAKSSPDAPAVSTLTLATWPEAFAVTVTVWALDAEPTATDPRFACAWRAEAAAATTMRTAEPRLRRLRTNARREWICGMEEGVWLMYCSNVSRTV